MDEQVLQSLGLNHSQIAAYLYLVRNGKQTPVGIAAGTGESRTNTYNLLEQLEKLGLAEKIDSDNPRRTHYQAKNPSSLKQLLVLRTRELNQTNAALSSLLPTLQSVYRLAYDQPGIVQAEGKDALQMIYDDVIKGGQEPLIFASDYDRDDPDTAAIIDEQIGRQQAAGIGAKVLIKRNHYSVREVKQLVEQGVEVRQNMSANLPAQVMVYGDNVALTTFRHGVSSTVITNLEVAESFRRLFLELFDRPLHPEEPADLGEARG